MKLNLGHSALCFTLVLQTFLHLDTRSVVFKSGSLVRVSGMAVLKQHLRIQDWEIIEEACLLPLSDLDLKEDNLSTKTSGAWGVAF